MQDAITYLRSWSNDFGDGTIAEGLVACCYDSLAQVQADLTTSDFDALSDDLATLYVNDHERFRCPELKAAMVVAFTRLLTEHREEFLAQIQEELNV